MTPTTTPTSGAADLPEPHFGEGRYLGLAFRSDAYSVAQVQALFASHGQVPAQQPAQSSAETLGNIGYDYQTAADLLSGKTVSDETMHKFVAASRWAHDDRVGLRATLLSVRGELASREAEIALLKNALMDAEESRPSTTAQADSVLEDAARLDYLHSTGSTIEMLPGEVDFYPMRFRVGGLRSAVSPNLREAIDAARKQGKQ